ncbi:MAG: hypothetical protein F6K63_15115 [Moorea sp. SIO1G6]|uniref:hypothetical protein n=1 Tax=Moorena sp. SIO1G6 TaxID=2607840 RepID=UPI0013BFDFD6|nr:hypothetical protein [Moorena sp. SIO1G6]NET65642.1 hypothetical protein [Moorena sp. SIO1G6]
MRLARRATLRSGSVSAKPTLRERKAWPTASASALMRLARRATLRDRILRAPNPPISDKSIQQANFCQTNSQTN